MPFINLVDALAPNKEPEVKISNTLKSGCSIAFEVDKNSYVVSSIDLDKCQSTVKSNVENMNVDLKYTVSHRRLTLLSIDVENNVMSNTHIVVEDNLGNVIFAQKLDFDEKGHAEINKTLTLPPGKQFTIYLVGNVAENEFTSPKKVALKSISFDYSYKVEVGPYAISVRNGKVEISKFGNIVANGSVISVDEGSLPIEVSYSTKTSNQTVVGYISRGKTVSIASLNLNTIDLELDQVTATPYIVNDEPKIGAPLGIVASPSSISLEVVTNSPSGERPKQAGFKFTNTPISEFLNSSVGPTDEFLVYAQLKAGTQYIRFIPFGSYLVSILDLLPARVFRSPEGESIFVRVSKVRTSLLSQKTKSLPIFAYYDYSFGNKDIIKGGLRPIFVGAVATEGIEIVPLEAGITVDASLPSTLESDIAGAYSNKIKPKCTNIKSVKVYFTVLFNKNGKLYARVAEASTLGDLAKTGIVVDSTYSSKKTYAVKNGVVYVVKPVVLTANQGTAVNGVAFPFAVAVECANGTAMAYVLEYRDLLMINNGLLTLRPKLRNFSIDPLVIGSMDIIVVRNGTVIYNPSTFKVGDMLYIFSEVPVGVGPFFITKDGTVTHFSDIKGSPEMHGITFNIYEFEITGKYSDGSSNSILVIGSSLDDIWKHVEKFIEVTKPDILVINKRGAVSTGINYPAIWPWKTVLSTKLPKLSLTTNKGYSTVIAVNPNGFTGTIKVEVDSVQTQANGAPCAVSSYEAQVSGLSEVLVSTNSLLENMYIFCSSVADAFFVKLYAKLGGKDYVLVDLPSDIAFMKDEPQCQVGSPVAVSSGSKLYRYRDCANFGVAGGILLTVNAPTITISNNSVMLSNGYFVKVYRLTVEGTKPKLEDLTPSTPTSTYTFTKPGLHILVYEFTPKNISKVLRGVVVAKVTGFKVVEEGDGIVAEASGESSATIEIDSGSTISGVAPIYKPCCSSSAISGGNILAYSMCRCSTDIVKIKISINGTEVYSTEVAKQDVQGKIVATGVSASVVASILIGGLI